MPIANAGSFHGSKRLQNGLFGVLTERVGIRVKVERRHIQRRCRFRRRGLRRAHLKRRGCTRRSHTQSNGFDREGRDLHGAMSMLLLLAREVVWYQCKVCFRRQREMKNEKRVPLHLRLRPTKCVHISRINTMIRTSAFELDYRYRWGFLTVNTHTRDKDDDTGCKRVPYI